MLPNQLSADHFASYPPQARQLAEAHLALLRDLPLAFIAPLLQELIAYDWKFPAERRDLDTQLAYLSSLAEPQRRQAMAPFDRLRLSPELEKLDWPSSPARFVEDFTAHLWATHQIDAFRSAAQQYMQQATAAAPEPALPAPRLGVIAIGQGVQANTYAPFRRLRPHGAWFTNLNPENGWPILRDAVSARAAAYPVPYGHWYIDGGAPEAAPPNLTNVSWNGVAPLRSALLERIRKAKQSGAGSEAVRSLLARMEASDLGSRAPGDPVLDRFQISLLTEGSGTQLYNTTFVQWTAREALRRAQPITLLARFTPRDRELSLGELLANPRQQRLPDPQGSLVDADMGAYYTWICQQRLSQSEPSRFLVWFEGHGEALAIAPALSPGTENHDRIDLRELLRRIV
jgi:hypothetical protein